MSRQPRARRALIVLLGVSILATAASAHTGHESAHDFLGGLLHPFTGLDHALAMIAVGALAWSLGDRARWLLPAGFLVMLLAGMKAGFSGFVLPEVETAIAASVAAMGAMLLAGRRLPAGLALALVPVFGVVHGNAHAAEIQAASFASHGSGFFLATAILHAAGLVLGATVTRLTVRSPCAQFAQRALRTRRSGS